MSDAQGEMGLCIMLDLYTETRGRGRRALVPGSPLRGLCSALVSGVAGGASSAAPCSDFPPSPLSEFPTSKLTAGTSSWCLFGLTSEPGSLCNRKPLPQTDSWFVPGTQPCRLRHTAGCDLQTAEGTLHPTVRVTDGDIKESAGPVLSPVGRHSSLVSLRTFSH